jgi:hypothetical protein
MPLARPRRPLRPLAGLVGLLLACGGGPAGSSDGSSSGEPPGSTGDATSEAPATTGGTTGATATTGAETGPGPTSGGPTSEGTAESTGAADTTGGPGGVSFTEVFEQVLVPQSCTSGYCHGGGAGGLDMMDEATAYASLVDVPAVTPVCGLAMRVVPGAPDESITWLRARPAALDDEPCAPKMPQGSSGLSEADAQLVKDWIAGGALE